MLTIAPLAGPADAHLAAQTMATSEPWLTLGRAYEESLAIVNDRSREVFAAHDDCAFRGFLIMSPRTPIGGYIAIVAVTAGARGTGVGSRLLDFAEDGSSATPPTRSSASRRSTPARERCTSAAATSRWACCATTSSAATTRS